MQRFDAEPTPEQAFDVLRLLHARDGRALALEVRPSASPILDVGDHAYVVMKTGKRRHGGPPGFAVTFQSVHNSEHWFPEASDVGVACRPIGRGQGRRRGRRGRGQGRRRGRQEGPAPSPRRLNVACACVTTTTWGGGALCARP